MFIKKIFYVRIFPSGHGLLKYNSVYTYFIQRIFKYLENLIQGNLKRQSHIYLLLSYRFIYFLNPGTFAKKMGSTGRRSGSSGSSSGSSYRSRTTSRPRTQQTTGGILFKIKFP